MLSYVHILWQCHLAATNDNDSLNLATVRQVYSCLLFTYLKLGYLCVVCVFVKSVFKLQVNTISSYQWNFPLLCLPMNMLAVDFQSLICIISFLTKITVKIIILV